MVSSKHDLTTALDTFRLSRAEAEYGPAAYSLRAYNLVLPDTVLARLVECASVKKIGSLDDIKRETKWPASKAEKYGGVVLEILLRLEDISHFPLAPPMTTTPLATRTLGSSCNSGENSKKCPRNAPHPGQG
ncbi:uncharacterized protein B0H18DRAFT_951958 [Fomitopsis serialis]|uniref:uncharacterized protein n=1 Tax=Fomitopsis serialis TaxID=139415 RepID=UPI0020082046|nr:uncharacterized protein B0H18DRAFT_951958 [Neoantrodia serialis]KAH9933400.1 hypothetical protein B0H18DRAFT_951958 [Neoantrodia serialis]